MTLHSKKTGSVALARKPTDVSLPAKAEIANRSDKPATATVHFDFDSADPDILRALQEAGERNGFEMQTAQARVPSSSKYRGVTLPRDFKGRPN